MRVAAPSVSAASSTQPASRMRASVAAASPEDSGSDSTLSKRNSPRTRVLSIVVSAIFVRPTASAFTRCDPPLRSETIKISACAKSSTNSADPLSLPLATVTPAPSRAPAIDSEIAMPASACPEASFGSHSRCCASLPAPMSASGASTDVAMNGTGATCRPSISDASAASSSDKPAPPNASGIRMPDTPSSTSASQTSRAGSLASADLRTRSSGQMRAKVRSRLSCSIFWSDDSANSITQLSAASLRAVLCLYLPQRGEVAPSERSEDGAGGGRLAMNIPPPGAILPRNRCGVELLRPPRVGGGKGAARSRSPRHLRFARQAEAALGDDVLLDLRGAAADDEAEIEHVHALPGALGAQTRAVAVEHTQLAQETDGEPR